jgi:hypothetical protein
MNEVINCLKASRACKLICLLLLIAAVWFYLAFDRHIVWPARCSGVNMKIEGGEVRGAQIEGDHLAITADFPSQHVTKVILYDYCSGKVLSSVESSK